MTWGPVLEVKPAGGFDGGVVVCSNSIVDDSHVYLKVANEENSGAVQLTVAQAREIAQVILDNTVAPPEWPEPGESVSAVVVETEAGDDFLVRRSNADWMWHLIPLGFGFADSEMQDETRDWASWVSFLEWRFGGIAYVAKFQNVYEKGD